MKEFFMIFLIAVALSMDTFSLSLSFGTFNISFKRGLILSIMVGIMHILMPLAGIYVGSFVLDFVPFNNDLILGTIFIILSAKATYDLFIQENERIELSIVNMIIFAFGVSLDAFTTGIALTTSNVILTVSTFGIISFLFTIMGIVLGKYANKILGKISSCIGIIILLILAIKLII